MKKIFLLSVLLAFCITTSNAQYRKHEVELGIGIWNINEMINTATDVIVSTLPAETEMVNGNSFGSIHAGYKYRILERVGVGGVFAFDYAHADAELNNYQFGKFRKHHYTLAAEADFIYLNFDKFKMYALAGVGATLYNLNYVDDISDVRNDHNSTAYFTFQLTPIGFKWGGKWGGFLEFGFGYRGLINAGLFLRL